MPYESVNPLDVYQWYRHEMGRPEVDLALISGVGCGLLAARGALAAMTPYVLVLPHIGYKPDNWKLGAMWRHVTEGAVHIHYISNADYLSGPAIMLNLDKFIVDHVDQIFTVYRKGRSEASLDYATLTRIPNLVFDPDPRKSEWMNYMDIDRPQDRDFPSYMFEGHGWV